MTIRACLAVTMAGLGFIGLAQAAAGQNTDRGDISAGYQFVNVLPANGAGNQAFPGGWYVGFAGNVTRSLAVVAEIGGNYKALSTTESHGNSTTTYGIDLRVHEFMGGVRASRRHSAVRPFGQVLVGAAELTAVGSTWASIEGPQPYSPGSDSRTYFAFQAGGGINVGVTKAMGVRVGADYLRVFSSDHLPADLNVFRFVTGLNFGF